MNRPATRAGLIGRGLAAVALAMVLIFSFAGAAQANQIDPPGTGNNDCSPRPYIYASGNTIVYNAWTRCSGPWVYYLQALYGANDGPLNGSGLYYCWAGASQYSCGVNGEYVYQTDNRAGLQLWCVSAVLAIFDQHPKGSTLACVWH
jgi:hypothetical protein